VDAVVAAVPNLSEGRRASVIEAIVSALRGPGVRVVGVHADPDHNRLDATVLGAPDEVAEAVFAGAAVAVELIDMEAHRGAHPRIGAVDVVPFVPIRAIQMEDVIGLARGFGERLAAELDLPVYLYERAALREDRRSLAAVRAGQFEGLRAAVARGERLPDLGPPVIGRAGAVAVGARPPLVAFNVYLDDPDDAVARGIAAAVRTATGGLPAVRAIGFVANARGIATVSMNLLDIGQTSVRSAFDEVTRLASERGVEVIDSEIVGLVPAAALAPGDAEHVRLVGFDPDRQVIERLLDRPSDGG
jgi:glutamate formiminotransferase